MVYRVQTLEVGVKWDVRKDEPYSIYDRFEFEVPTGTGEFGTLGDCFDRFWGLECLK
ncbi:MAG: hypothetical protein Ct9H90mP20_1940 [Candidatus Neomarinimicrobiota bacterium]|nr:MAG: hypothetical protein Ct9H90mP20_1940 [Candidatus Neomarinimicrobiota bacterium]